MKEYNWLKIFLIFFLIFYFVAGLSTEFFLPGNQKEAIPLFSWFLFDIVPNEAGMSVYAVRISEFNGKKINPPILYDQAYGIVDDPQSPKARELIRRLGTSLEHGPKWQTDRLHNLLEQIYLPKPIQYEVDIVTYAPLLRFQSGIYKTLKLAEYKSI